MEQQAIQQDQNSEDLSQSQLRQVVFPIHIDSDCSEEEKQALEYLLKVRNQAEGIKDNYKLIIEQPIIEKIKQSNSQQEIYQNWFIEWKLQTIKNWKCVIQNIIYLINSQKYNQQGLLAKQQINIEKIPQIKQLANILTLDQIEKTIVYISERYHQEHYRIQYRYNYYIWIYSLLALHQCQASYIYFEALGSINSCIFQQNQFSPEILIVSVILIQQFQQQHLKKLVHQNYLIKKQ